MSGLDIGTVKVGLLVFGYSALPRGLRLPGEEALDLLARDPCALV